MMTHTKNRQRHWDDVYAARAPEAVTWYQENPAASLSLIQGHGAPDAPLIDIGGGASTLVDHLLAAGFGDVSVLDVSDVAIGRARKRLAAQASSVTWIKADITQWKPSRRYGLWHDRAVFHFLTDGADRKAYIRALDDALAPDGTAIIATFGMDGPEKCSGLPVEHYDQAKLAGELGPIFQVLSQTDETHVTPKGNSQAFSYFVVTRRTA